GLGVRAPVRAAVCGAGAFPAHSPDRVPEQRPAARRVDSGRAADVRRRGGGVRISPNRSPRTGPAVTSPSEPPRHGASGGSHPPELARRFGLLEATALNMTNMMGVGPFITIPLLMTALGGPQAMLGWVVALLIVIPDGMVWSELGSAMPGSGGSYVYLREGYGREKWGRLAGFLFIWQFVLSGPLEIASGYIGLSQYAGYLWPSLNGVHFAILAAAVGVL